MHSKKTGVIVFTHGSRLKAGNDIMVRLVDRLRAQLGSDLVEPCFMELAQPDMPSAIEKLIARGCNHIFGYAFFLVPGKHLQHDIPEITDATAIVRAAIEYWRDVSSYAVFDMNIHRPDWQRSMTMRVWTRGDKESLVRVTAPARDAGNGTLLLDNDMCSYNPKINRVIKVPSSLMNQSWMGSDFSNNDLARADDLIDQYRHTLLATETHDGHRLYVIEATPNETAPVVWGREVIKIRDDYLVMEHAFYEQANVLVKKLVTTEVKKMGGKMIAARERMQKIDKPQNPGWSDYPACHFQYPWIQERRVNS